MTFMLLMDECPGIDEYPEEVSAEEFASFDDTVAATEPMLSVSPCNGT